MFCFCFAVEDVERNDGSLSRPYFMSKRLMKMLLMKPDEIVPTTSQ